MRIKKGVKSVFISFLLKYFKGILLPDTEISNPVFTYGFRLRGTNKVQI